MNKLSIALLVATIFAVNTQAEYGWRHRDGGQKGHHYFEMKKEKWNNAINELTDKQTKTDAKKLLATIEKQHDIMVKKFEKIDTIRQKKHENMNKLNKMLGLPMTRPMTRAVVQEKVGKVRTAVTEKAQEIKAVVQQKVEKAKDDVKQKIEKAKADVQQKIEKAKEDLETKKEAIMQKLEEKKEELKTALEKPVIEMKEQLMEIKAEAKS